MRTIYAGDLFCGAGGATSGLMLAARQMGVNVELVAVNHWTVAVETHRANHPGFVHYCQAVGKVKPLEAVPGGYLDILLAGPECINFSRAKGGKPKNKQSRASAFDIIWWLEELDVHNVLIENVEEWQDWGPLDEHDQPIPRFKGFYFRQFCDTLRELGYEVQHRILCAADYGDPTTRRRLFLMATKGGSPVWPSPSHRPAKDVERFPGTKRWVPAREIIDWNLKGESIYTRKKPLSANTLRRIFTGIRKFAGLPFIVPQFGEAGPRSVERPLNTLTTESRGVGICQPFLTANFGERDGQEPRTVGLDEPAPTVTSRGAGNLIEPMLIVFRNHCDGRPLSEPISTLCTSKGHYALIEPFLVGAGGPTGTGEPRSLQQPIHTLLAENHTAVVEPFLYYGYGGKDAASADKPLPAVTATWAHLGVVEPFLVRYNGQKGKRDDRTQSIDEPLTTLDTSNRFALCQFVVSYYGNGECALSLADPLDTVTTHDRFGLVQLEWVSSKNGQETYAGKVVGWLDILFRMLQPHELSAAHSFPASYRFSGTKSDQVKQIGNSWPVRTGAALCHSLLTRTAETVRPAHRQTGIAARAVKVLDIPVATLDGGLYGEALHG